ncbi:MAG: helix-turn-helix transcriptional regulator [Chitinophagaceae bacterium]|nr:helix-turn-helix transcriptional regulator [Chitinophagaceae bacterium]
MIQRRHTTPDVGVNIKKCREIRNYTQYYMAHELDISTTAYRNIESGKTAITLDYMYAIAAILSVNINALLYYDEQLVLSVYSDPAAPATGVLSGTEIKDMICMLKTAQEKMIEMTEESSRLSREVNTMVQHITRLVLELTEVQKKK